MTQAQVSTAWCRFEWMWKVHCYPGCIRRGVCVAALLFPQHSERVQCLPSPHLWAWKLSCKTGATELWEAAYIHTFLLRLYIPAHGNCSKQQASQNHCCISFLTKTHIQYLYTVHTHAKTPLQFHHASCLDKPSTIEKFLCWEITVDNGEASWKEDYISFSWIILALTCPEN